MALTIKANCANCGEKVEVLVTGEPTLRQTDDGGWMVVIPADGWDWDLHKMGHIESRCRHCGQGPEVDGDHSCPCPYPDADCPDHPATTS